MGWGALLLFFLLSSAASFDLGDEELSVPFFITRSGSESLAAELGLLRDGINTQPQLAPTSSPHTSAGCGVCGWGWVGVGATGVASSASNP